ncbi:MAG TPA: tyrosine-type recombinase/integrase, partial [Stellaceae bacterium]|nr:tyrosine-type recombinase/integrase [Stellaceae bacterium]
MEEVCDRGNLERAWKRVRRLADVPPEIEWFANITNPNSRRAYEAAVGDFIRFAGIRKPEEFRTVTRAHVIAWRDDLARRALGGATVRHRLAALSSLFEYLCDKNTVTHNPVKGVRRPRAESGESRTPALGDHQARDLLAAPGKDTAADEEAVKEKRYRAILSTLLFHALRRDELCKLTVRDFRHARRGVPHLRVTGKGEKTRYLPLHPGTHALIHDYLEAAGHGGDENGALFRPIRNNRTPRLDKALTPDAVYKLVRRYSAALGFEIGAHALRATAATNALDHQADIAKVAGMARPRQHRHHPHLRPSEDPPRGQPDVQGGILNLPASVAGWTPRPMRAMFFEQNEWTDATWNPVTGCTKI